MPEKATVSCPECHASNSVGERYCASCGLVLPRPRQAAASDDEAAHSDRPSRRAPPARLRKREESRYVGRSQTTLSAIRALYGVLALLTGLVALLAWGAYMDEPDRTGGDFLAIALLTATAGLNIAGFVCFKANPFVWTLMLAGLQTLGLVMRVVKVEEWSGVVTVVILVQALFVLALWCAVPIAARVMKILRERAAAAKTDGKAAPLATRAAAREMDEQRRAVRTFAITAGAVAALALVAAWLPYRASAANRAKAKEIARQAEERERQAEGDRERRRAQRDARASAFERTRAEFGGTWASSDLDEVKSYFESSKQETYWPKVVEVLEKRGWKDKLPTLGKPDIEEHGEEEFDAFYPLKGGEVLKTRWGYIDGRWRIVRFMFGT